MKEEIDGDYNEAVDKGHIDACFGMGSRQSYGSLSDNESCLPLTKRECNEMWDSDLDRKWGEDSDNKDSIESQDHKEYVNAMKMDNMEEWLNHSSLSG
jgi:hypothetical protein